MEVVYVSYTKEWLRSIKDDILKKYQIEDPVFVVHRQVLSQEEIIGWIDKYVVKEDKFIKYKYLSENIFELKSFYPDPSDEACQESVDRWIEFIENHERVTPYKHLIQEGEKKYCYRFDHIYYTKKEIKKELFLLFKLRVRELSWFPSYFIDQDTRTELLMIFIYDRRAASYEIIEDGLCILEYKE